MAYYIEYLGKCLISKSYIEDSSRKPKTHLSAARQIENLICTHRESLLGSSAWRQDFLKDIQSRPFFMSQKSHPGLYFYECGDEDAIPSNEKCAACGRSTQTPEHRVSLFGPHYNAVKIWESHWINCVPKVSLI